MALRISVLPSSSLHRSQISAGNCGFVKYIRYWMGRLICPSHGGSDIISLCFPQHARPSRCTPQEQLSREARSRAWSPGGRARGSRVGSWRQQEFIVYVNVFPFCVNVASSCVYKMRKRSQIIAAFIDYLLLSVHHCLIIQNASFIMHMMLTQFFFLCCNICFSLTQPIKGNKIHAQAYFCYLNAQVLSFFPLFFFLVECLKKDSLSKAKKEYTRVNKYPIIWLARKQEAVIDGAGQPILVANRVGLQRQQHKTKQKIESCQWHLLSGKRGLLGLLQICYCCSSLFIFLMPSVSTVLIHPSIPFVG